METDDNRPAKCPPNIQQFLTERIFGSQNIVCFQMDKLLFFLFASQFLAYTNLLPSRKPTVVPGASSRLSSVSETFCNAQNVHESQSGLRRSSSIATTPIFLVALF
jgi:hypothetical protein